MGQEYKEPLGPENSALGFIYPEPKTLHIYQLCGSGFNHAELGNANKFSESVRWSWLRGNLGRMRRQQLSIS